MDTLHRSYYQYEFPSDLKFVSQRSRTIDFARRLDVFSDITHKFQSVKDLEGLLQVSLKEGLQELNIPNGSIMILDPVSKMLEIKAWIENGQFIEKESHNNFRLGQGIAGAVAKIKTPAYIHNVASEPAFIQNSNRPIGSLLCIPIISFNRLLGVFNADHPGKDFFTVDDFKFLNYICEQLAVAIENKQLRAMISKYNSFDSLELLQYIVKSAVELTGSESGVIYINPLSKNAHQTIKYPPEFSMGIPRKQGGLTAKILATGETVIVRNVINSSLVRDRVKKSGIKTLIGIKLGKNVVLYINRRDNREFSLRDQDLLQRLIDPAKGAIERLEDLSRYQKLTSSLTTLHKVTLQMKPKASISELLSMVSKMAVHELNADSAGVLLLDESREFLSFAGGYGIGEEALIGTMDPVGKSIAGRVLAEKKAIIVNDVNTDSRFDNPAADEEKWLSIISIPVWENSTCIGTLDVHSRTRRHAFAEEDLKLLNLLAHQVEIILAETGYVPRLKGLVSLQANLTAESARLDEYELFRVNSKMIDAVLVDHINIQWPDNLSPETVYASLGIPIQPIEAPLMITGLENLISQIMVDSYGHHHIDEIGLKRIEVPKRTHKASVTNSPEESHSIVLLARQRSNTQPESKAASLIKISHARNAVNEIAAYHNFVRPHIAAVHCARIEGDQDFAIRGQLGAIRYTNLIQDGRKTLYHWLRKSDQADSWYTSVLSHLFESVLANWYQIETRDEADVNLYDYYAGLIPKIDLLCSQPMPTNDLRLQNFSGMRFINPISWIQQNRAKSTFSTSIEVVTHGDLHTNNIMVKPDESVMIIDYERVGPGHRFRDFVEFEADILLKCLRVNDNVDFKTLVHFGRQLLFHESLSSRFALLSGLDSELLKTYQMVKGLRQKAHAFFPQATIEEYFWALLLDSTLYFPDNLLDTSHLTLEDAWKILYPSLICERLNMDQPFLAPFNFFMPSDSPNWVG